MRWRPLPRRRRRRRRLLLLLEAVAAAAAAAAVARKDGARRLLQVPRNHGPDRGLAQEAVDRLLLLCLALSLFRRLRGVQPRQRRIIGGGAGGHRPPLTLSSRFMDPRTTREIQRIFIRLVAELEYIFTIKTHRFASFSIGQPTSFIVGFAAR